MPQLLFLGKIAAKKAKNQKNGNVTGQSGTSRPKTKKPIIHTARLFFSTPTSRSQTLQKAIQTLINCDISHDFTASSLFFFGHCLNKPQQRRQTIASCGRQVFGQTRIGDELGFGGNNLLRGSVGVHPQSERNQTRHDA